MVLTIRPVYPRCITREIVDVCWIRSYDCLQVVFLREASQSRKIGKRLSDPMQDY